MTSTDTKPSLPDIEDPWEEMTRAKQKKTTTRRKVKTAAAGLAAAVLACAVTTGLTAAALNGARDDAAAALTKAEGLYGQRQDTTLELVGFLFKSEPFERNVIDPAILSVNMSSVNTPDSGAAGKKFANYATAQADMESALRLLKKTTTDRHKDLQANKAFTTAMSKSEAAAPGIAAAQADYNEAAARYNGIRDGFPGVLLAPLLGHGTPWGTFSVSTNPEGRP